MARKRKRPLPKGWYVDPEVVAAWLNDAIRQIARRDFTRAIDTCQRVLRQAPPGSEVHQYGLSYLGLAHIMLQHLDEAYEVLTQAVELYPNEADLWYNRGLACRYTIRLGQSLRDFERATELAGYGPVASKVGKELESARKLVRESLELRGPHFTLDQLIEQEELFQTGIKLMAAADWPRAEQAFRQTIEMADCLPQPWSNLGTCLTMQSRFDEAEVALKRAIEMDPEYQTARQNLAAVAEARRTGELPMSTVRGPFEGEKLKISFSVYRR